MLNFIKQLFQGSQPKECFCSKYEEDPSRKNTCKVCGHSITKHEDKCGKCTYVQQVATKDRKTPEQQEKDRVRRGKINGEVISTEETYVESLRQMVRFQHGLADCLDKKKLLTLFSNVESLLGLHEDMLKDFKANISSGGSDPSLAATFIKYGPMLRLYKEYASNHESATKLMQDLVKKSKFVAACREVMGNTEATGEMVSLTIGSLLITPIQRIPRYMLLIQDLIKHTLPTAPTYKDLEKADTVVAEVAYEVNEYVKVEEGLSKAVQVERLLIGNPTKLSGKQFIFEGELDEIAAKSQTKYHAFLFEDILVYSHTKIGAFWKYKGCIELKPTLDVRVIENPQTFENVFQVVDGAEHRTFFTGTAKEMNDWVANFSKAIEAVKKKKTPEQAKDADDKAKKEKEKKEKEEKEKKEKEEKEKKEKEEKEKEKAKKDKDKEKEKEKAKKEKEKEKAKKEKEKEKEKKEKEKEKEKAKKEKEKEKERKEKEKEKERKEKEKAKKK